jgi:2-isopropylmalate synthase
MTAFGMTKRAGRSADNDEVLAGVLNAGTSAVCLVGKTHDFHVTEALGITLEENVENIAASVAHLVAKGREALFDAEHFFDGYKANPAMRSMPQAPRWRPGRAGSCSATPMVARCPGRSGASPAEVIAAGIPGERLGIHTHNDTETAVAGSLAAVEAGRAAGAGHAERPRRALRQRQPHLADPHASSERTLGQPLRDRDHGGRRWRG